MLHQRVPIEFNDDFGGHLIKCPVCVSSYLHTDGVTIIQGDGTADEIAVGENEDHSRPVRARRALMKRRPISRRTCFVYRLSCESGHEANMQIVQSKGSLTIRFVGDDAA
jgi:hypothetical protein